MSDDAVRDLAADLLVVGGNLCGAGAAIAAARAGARVVLIERGPIVGGHTTSGLNTAETEHMHPWTIGGLADEYFRRIGRRYGRNHPVYFFESKVALAELEGMLDEAGVECITGVIIRGVTAESGVIREVELSDGTRIAAAAYVDASYEGDLMAKAGVRYAVGREAVEQYDEPLAGIRLDTKVIEAATVDAAGRPLTGVVFPPEPLVPGAADGHVQCYNFRPIVTRRRDNSVPLMAPADYDPARYALLTGFLSRLSAGAREKLRLINFLGLYPRVNGKMEVNNAQGSIISIGMLGEQSAYPDGDEETRRAVIDRHRSWAQGMLWYLATEPCVPRHLRAAMSELGYAADEFEDYGHFPPLFYVRESRRMIGQYVMTQRDVKGQEANRRKTDSIGLASHYIDCHHVQRVALGPDRCVHEGVIWVPGDAYEVPYRAILPRPEEARNLLVPGCASFSHVAFCTYRLESSWMVMGQAAGVAAVQMCERDADAHAVDVVRVQRSLTQQNQMLHLREGRELPREWFDRMVDPQDTAWVYGSVEAGPK